VGPKAPSSHSPLSFLCWGFAQLKEDAAGHVYVAGLAEVAAAGPTEALDAYRRGIQTVNEKVVGMGTAMQTFCES
jgi:hypothetical protein